VVNVFRAFPLIDEQWQVSISPTVEGSRSLNSETRVGCDQR